MHTAWLVIVQQLLFGVYVHVLLVFADACIARASLRSEEAARRASLLCLEGVLPQSLEVQRIRQHCIKIVRLDELSNHPLGQLRDPRVDVCRTAPSSGSLSG
jgi:hypothetical protein